MLEISRSILIGAPRESVRRYLQDIGHIPDYELKARSLKMGDIGSGGGSVEAAGRFLGLPWRGQFRLDFTPDGGYQARMTQGSLKSMSFSFRLRPVLGGTLLAHEECYQFPFLLRPLTFLFKKVLSEDMGRKLHVIKEGAERVNRQLQLEAIEAS